ncbi:PREDICTED: uncharacterized protein LOC101299224 [Fragaria vesca subsp. vesca]|uniref:uncharacterized protein LOC101299224 n=1 Tax=Fragaria vesca subsp. vesca TaxID=101020 RepID=UPI0002C323F3|nr:PREDICTED: uncharacterized protein LOC101299224 [Fragaria vesca subsp. vesca]
MAQAARLSLRLQKELKLLLTDPPPGASFPLLSSSSSLSSILAQIQGPEGTVYAGGLFNIKIEIPDRYPFQPPSVTFATPIYHPNIDTGGRICLDILNLPPKGAWQPSLNISTVLTSIGLLLSEPNPDDGLMCEASREFKYNRQAFDQKARSMTEKYAQAGANGSSVCDGQFESLASLNSLEVDTTGHESKHPANESVVQLEVKTSSHGLKHDANLSVTSHKKLIGMSRKLSLESSVPAWERDAHKEVPKDQMEVEGSEKLLKDNPNKCTLSQEKLCGSRRKLSLGSFSQSQEKSDHGIENNPSKCNLSQEELCGSRRKLSLGSFSQSQEKSDNDIGKVDHCSSVEQQNVPMPSSGKYLPLSGNAYKQGLHPSQDSKLVDDNINKGSKRLRFGNKQSLGSLSTNQMISEKTDEMIVTPQLPPSQPHTNVLSEPLPAAPALDRVKRQPNTHTIDGMGNATSDASRKRLCLTGKKLSLGFRGSLQAQGKDNKENVVPHMSEFNGIGSKNGGENATHKKLGIAHLEENNSNMHLSSNPSKSLPKQHQDFRAAEKQHQDYTDTTATTKQKKAEEPSILESESVIVLDSEDSEEENSSRVKSKPVLARKRLGRWRVRT